MNHLVRIAFFTLAALALFAGSVAEAKARKAKELLQYIPADTPYVMAFTKPLPDDLMDKFEPAIDKTLAAYQRMLRYQLSEQLVELAAQEGGADKAEHLQALMHELIGLMSIQGLRDAGIGRDSLFAVYGDGVLPVFRLALTDRKRFEATVERIEAKADEKFRVGTLDDKSYRYRDMEGVRLIIATFGDDAVITVVPTGFSEERLSQTLGLKKPRKSLASSKELSAIAKEFDFTDHFVSFIDVEKLAATFMGDPSGLNSELLEMIDYDASEMTPQCRAEFTSLAAITPRILMGYKAVNEDFLETQMIVELRDDIAAGLAKFPAAVPGLGTDFGGLLSFGFSLDLLAARTFYEGRLDAMEAEPFECEALAELQASTVKGREALAQPLPPVVYSFRGILANISDIEGMDLATQTPPESIDASILFAVENAEALVTMAAMMSPEVAALNLIADGKAKPLNLPQLSALAEQAFAALSENALSVSLGDGSDRDAEAMLTADVLEALPFASFSMDAKRYYELVAKAVMEDTADEEGEPLPEAMRAAIRDVMISSGDLYERMSINVHLTGRGVEIGSRMTLSD